MGLGVADSAIGMGMGLLLGKINDKRQLKQQQKLQDMQMQGNLQMLKAQEEKELRMWKNTSYEAQKEQMKLAGLNPGLMYGMGGGGGQTVGGSGGGVSGGHAPAGGGEAVQMAGMGLQMGLQKAQLDNIEAQTAKTKAEAKKLEGVDTEKGYAEIRSLSAGVENTEARTELTRVETRLQKLEEQFKGRTMETNVERAGWELNRVQEEVDNLARNNRITKALEGTIVDKAKAELATALLMPELMKAQTANIDMDTVKKREEMFNLLVTQAQKWRELEIAGTADARKEREFADNVTNEMSQITGMASEALTGIVQAIILKRGLGGTHTPVKGFGK